ncbi:hypothetical protein HYT24_00095 [Candidatus Pacearchaeota archaeon]|nr:hypothetical protein [Candidatus Pacearchaeota archaeon]
MGKKTLIERAFEEGITFEEKLEICEETIPTMGNSIGLDIRRAKSPENVERIKESVDLYLAERGLNETLQELFVSLQEGNHNYGKKIPRIGNIDLVRESQRYEIRFSPSQAAKEKDVSYKWRGIGEVDLNNMTYSLATEKDAESTIERVVLRDTEKVMNQLGLKKEDSSAKYEISKPFSLSAM